MYSSTNYTTYNILAHRYLILAISVCLSLCANAQKTISERLNEVLISQDFETGKRLYAMITDDDIKQMPDSVLFDYHYLGGYLFSSGQESTDINKSNTHLLAAKQLCEKSLGTYSLGYMEIMYGLGYNYIELNEYESALAFFQEGIVKSMAVRSVFPKQFSNLIMGETECYEALGWFNEIPKCFMDAWSFWDKDETPFVTYTYFPLWSLRQYYYRYSLYDNALSISDRIIEFITNKVGANHLEMAHELYMRGNVLVAMNRLPDAITTYQHGIDILKSNNNESNELYGMLCGNLLSCYVSIGKTDFEKTLKEIKSFAARTNNPSTYHDALYAVADILTNQGKFTEALTFNQRLSEQDLSHAEQQSVVQQQMNILYCSDLMAELPQLESQRTTLETGGEAWFETMKKLSDAYYLKHESDSNLAILTDMYNACTAYPSIGNNYLLWVLNSLYNLYLKQGQYNNALKCSFEKYTFLASLPDVPEMYRYNALNDIVVAKLKSNQLDGIDDDMSKLETYYANQFGTTSREYSFYLHNRGRAYQLQNRLDEAKATLLKAINIQNKVDGNPLEKTFTYYNEVVQELGEI